ncbi:MAG: 2,3,4,5-tetrahydropyridine-2,6-dicarboxylate N-succinyltransferase [Bdellovibrionaceae bacterium]|nr:2,3,4,5-tetrahydropyridine-2,6-dicarboxylate N-succinyltransferase [Pseudobdellovibrionaceae bacterium]|tara:strand:- start:3331 stop:4134 length:804 start_codon:yes stop_codon:yes gene_type:complete
MEDLINKAFENPTEISNEAKKVISSTINKLDQGHLRVCSFENNQWTVHQWIKKAILLYFRIQKMELIQAGDLNFFDKLPLKQWTGNEGVRVVPHALVRQGAFVEPGAILMPSYVNIGGYVGSGTLVDTWATVGSCAQIGKNVHLSGGVGIGGVLEPLQANPVIIEDDAFIGSRCIVVEGVHIESGAVLGAGVVLTASTPILDVTQSQVVEMKGRVPKDAVIIPGTRQKSFPAGDFGTPCALMIGKRKASTDKKTSLTDALREFEVSV